ncbi:hypothetical protein FHR70_003480 [Microvirga lupini]|uniref:Uncharacterized protein n=1 Tax=Microvirga lupini TaxID=420324 RepID=A0A7W4VNF6_9HYPH|nr:hypothetical protein [Microvirga lupini]MBB3020399.1 hypothetical protein [Microvirga lupini]
MSSGLNGPSRKPFATVVAHCRQCADFEDAEPLGVEDEAGEPDRFWFYEDHPDIGWVKRRRRCLSCERAYATGEVDESLIEELRELRGQVASQAAQIASLTEQLAEANQRAAAAAAPPQVAVPAWADGAVTAVPRVVAERIVSESAWWLQHPSGSACRAPRMADRLQNTRWGWAVSYGANWFAAALAAHRCAKIAKDVLNDAAAGRPVDAQKVKAEMDRAIWSSVLNHDLEQYPACSYRREQNDLVFGVHSIDIVDVRKVLLEVTGLGAVPGFA